ncbi:MAG: hypothetical protein FJ095_08360 [Deltaproteobacteria bacterium]|nr:hypothetical protein [Deltaproteobacteria bacterium]
MSSAAPASREAGDSDGHDPTWLRTTPTFRAGKLVVAPVLDVIAQYVLSIRKDDAGEPDWFHEFELPRAQFGAVARYGEARVGVVAETVRSTSGGALIGLAGDSIVLRIRAAFLGYRLFERLSLSAGVVPTLTIPAVESSSGLRVLAPTGLELTGASSPADLGTTARLELPRGFGTVAVGGYNGEGYTGRELNRGKNLELAAFVHPGALGPPWIRPLTVQASYVAGSNGTGLARADRLSAGLAYSERRVRVGALVTYGLGLVDDGARRWLLVDGYGRVEPLAGLILGAQLMHFRRDLSMPGDVLSIVTGSVGYRPVEALEALLAVDRQVAGEMAAPTLPGLDSWRIRAVARFQLEHPK